MNNEARLTVTIDIHESGTPPFRSEGKSMRDVKLNSKNCDQTVETVQSNFDDPQTRLGTINLPINQRNWSIGGHNWGTGQEEIIRRRAARRYSRRSIFFISRKKLLFERSTRKQRNEKETLKATTINHRAGEQDDSIAAFKQE